MTDVIDEPGTASPPTDDETIHEQTVVHREISFETDGDGRTLYTRVVPYNVKATVSDPPFFEPYQETWLPGAFDKQLRAANRVDVLLNFEHERGIGGVVGRGVELVSRADGLHGTFRLLGGNDGDKARELVAERVLTGLSLEAAVMKSRRGSDGAVTRVEARLKNVALCRTPAFPGAEVLAVREEPEPTPEPDEPSPAEPEPDEPKIIVPELVVPDEIGVLLERVGVSGMPRMEIERGRWDSTTDRFDDDQYAASCLIDRGGAAPAKERCSLPVLEPTGELNVSALAVAARLLPTTTGITNVQRAETARRMIRLFRLAGLEVPAQVTDAARR